MQFLEQEISEITETTWQIMLGLDIQVNALPPTIDLGDEYWAGKVEISGAFHGVVMLHGSGQLAHVAASAFFSNEHSEMTQQDRKDAIYELTNVIAGNVKSLLPEPSRLSLPLVLPTTSRSPTVPYAECVSEIVFYCQDLPLSVALWKQVD